METLDTAIRLFRAGKAEEARALCEERLGVDATDIGALSLLSELLVGSGHHADAVDILSRLSAIRPDDPVSRRRLAGALLALNRAREAADVLESAIRIDPANARAHNNLGQALLALGRRSEAIASLRTAVGLDPRYAIAHHNLGLAYDAVDDPSRALDCYGRALALAPHLVAAWVARGMSLVTLNRFDDALVSFANALELNPRDPLTLTHRAAVLLSMERAPESLSVADSALDVDAGWVAAHNVRAGALRRLGRRPEAVRALHSALALDPHNAGAWGNLGTILHEMGCDAEALDACRRAVDADPTDIRARTRLLARLIPSVPDSAAEAAASRQRFDAEFARLFAWLAERTNSSSDSLLLAQQQFFYLSYEEQCNRAVLSEYRGASAARIADIGELSSPPSRKNDAADARRFRLGFVSAHVYDHSVFNAILRGWLQGLDHRQFELALFNVGSRRDGCTEAAAKACDSFESGARDVVGWARCVRDRALDALIFPEIGMNETTLALASMRLAKHQFVAWGHPETSGLPTIDGYLSAELFEPPGAEAHYCERLIRLPNLGVDCRPYAVAPAAVDLEALRVARTGPLLICCGAPFKYRPQHDGIFIEIARRLGSCTFLFFDHEIPEVSRKLEARMAAAFGAGGLDPRRYLRWIPWQPRASFFALLGQADVYLDTIGFSGFNTLMQAVQCHLPCVTYAGRFMRGRLGSGILERLGMPELIAHDAGEYIALAVRLADDAKYRASVRAAMRQAEHLLYADESAIEALSRLLLGLRDSGD